jgi:hypothetical protein
MQGALVKEYEYLSSQCNAAVEALRSSRRAGLKTRHAMLNMNDWGRLTCSYSTPPDTLLSPAEILHFEVVWVYMKTYLI